MKKSASIFYILFFIDDTDCNSFLRAILQYPRTSLAIGSKLRFMSAVVLDFCDFFFVSRMKIEFYIIATT